MGGKIRRLANRQQLVAKKSRKDGLWFICDHRSALLTDERGLSDDEALAWLQQPA